MQAQEMPTPYEQSGGTKSVSYAQLIAFYKHLDKQYATLQMQEAGPTDTYYPLHVIYFDNEAKFDVQQWKAQGKLILLINNGIHPGEPDGIDASMMLLRDAASGKIKIPSNIVLAVVPIFNIGGMLNRGSYSRANQNGPEEYGFRGNAQNLDLNRDFIKMDAKETQSLIQLFHTLDPDLFIDNHVSNGADYQHIITLLSTQHSKLGGEMGKYLNEKFEPLMYKDMKTNGYDLVPYVNHFGATPDNGWQAFYELPRFASGFAALFQTYSFVPETHMLKTYKQRTDATYQLMLSFIKLASENAAVIKETRSKDRKAIQAQKEFALDWQVDTTKPTMITFKGYEAGYKPSEVSGLQRLYYDRSKPFTKQVPLYNTYSAKLKATAPKAYVVKHGWDRLIDRLKMNGVQMRQLDKDTVMDLSVYYIQDYETGKKPYEGHYQHSNVKLRKETRSIQLSEGDYIIATNQQARRYLVETLEPNAPDAFFGWGFFDAVLQQKEYFSDYVFEDEAAALLKKDAALKMQLEEKQKSDTTFAKSGAAQLDFIYKHSPYYEPVHMRYPVFRQE